MHRLRDCFEPVEYVADSGTMIFRLTHPIDPQRLEGKWSVEQFTDEEIQEAFAYSRSLVAEKMHPVLHGSLATLYAFADRFDEAREALQTARREEFDESLASVDSLITERQAWKLVVHRTLGPVQAGRRYVASFTARAEGPRIVPVALRRSKSPWDNMGLYRLLKLDDHDRRYEFEFTANGDDDAAVLQFAVGGNRLPLEARDLEFRAVGGTTNRSTTGSGPWCVFPVDDPQIERSGLKEDALMLSFR
jgi:hypothetical protein